MTEAILPSLHDMESLVLLLEHDRLGLLATIVARGDGCNEHDLQGLSLQGNAIRSLKEAIRFKKHNDASCLVAALAEQVGRPESY